jgi:hypothetical protein
MASKAPKKHNNRHTKLILIIGLTDDSNYLTNDHQWCLFD